MSNRSSVTVVVPSSLRELTGGRTRLQLQARSVEEALAQIRESEPLLAGRLFADGGEVRGFINVFVDGTEIRHLEPACRELRSGAVVTIVPSVAGG
ncbi:MAG: MoaD/ThiS family protein [Gemmatimonadetes bacterium]|nr:MoaD/ThiS family protein [Gemmatimonadota bacterium]